MTQEEKRLLLKDLCARQPYGVKVHIEYGDIPYGPATVTQIDVKHSKLIFNFAVPIENCKPYLRPLSSMTEEEKIELKYKTCPEGTGYFDEKALICPGNHYGEYIPYNFMSVILDWLLAHHFDVGNLIEKELALEAPEDMYKI